MKPIVLFLALAATAAVSPAHAADITPKCPPYDPAGGGASTNWGTAYDTHARAIFERAKTAAGVAQDVRLIEVKARSIDGSPISALPKGTTLYASADGSGILKTDAVVYGFGVFEITCDEAQLATFMLHEMRHLKQGADGKNHFDRVLACRKKMFGDWVNDPKTVLPANVTFPQAIAEFNRTKGSEYQKTCVLPVENEADEFAFATLPQLGYGTGGGADPNRDARARSFKNAELWAKAIGDKDCDDGHGCMDARAKAGAAAAQRQRDAQHEALQRAEKMSIPPAAFAP